MVVEAEWKGRMTVCLILKIRICSVEDNANILSIYNMGGDRIKLRIYVFDSFRLGKAMYADNSSYNPIFMSRMVFKWWSCLRK